MSIAGLADRQMVPPRVVASRWGVSVSKVIELIRAGQLRAIDSSVEQKQRPRFLIDIADVERFEQERLFVPEQPAE